MIRKAFLNLGFFRLPFDDQKDQNKMRFDHFMILTNMMRKT